MKSNEEILELAHDCDKGICLCNSFNRNIVMRAMELAQDEIRKEYEEKIRKAVEIAQKYTYSRDVCQESNWDLTKLKAPRSEIQFNNAQIIEALDGWQYYHEGE